MTIKKKNIFYVFAYILLLSFCLQGFHLYANPTPIKLYMIAVMLLFLFNLINNKTLASIYIPEIASLLFFLYMIVCAVWAKDLGLSSLKLIGIIFILFSYYTLRTSLESVNSDSLFKLISHVGLTVLLLSITYYIVGVMNLDSSLLLERLEGDERGFFGLYLEGVMPRMRGVFDSPNNLALICVFFYFFYESFETRYSNFGRVLSIFSLLFTLSLTGWIVVLMSYMVRFTEIRYFKKMLLLGLTGLCIGYFAVQLLPEDILNSVLIERVERISSGSGRDELFLYSFDLILEKPIFGYGLNQSRTLFENFRGFQSSHNSFLEAAIDGGVIGVILLMICWITFLIFAKRATRLTGNSFYFISAFSIFVFAQGNLLTYVELAVLYFSLCIAIFKVDSSVSLNIKESPLQNPCNPHECLQSGVIPNVQNSQIHIQ